MPKLQRRLGVAVGVAVVVAAVNVSVGVGVAVEVGVAVVVATVNVSVGVIVGVNVTVGVIVGVGVTVGFCTDTMTESPPTSVPLEENPVAEIVCGPLGTVVVSKFVVKGGEVAKNTESIKILSDTTSADSVTAIGTVPATIAPRVGVSI